MKFAIGDKVVEKKTIKPYTSYNTHKVVGYLNGAILVEHHGAVFDGEVHKDTWIDEPGSRNWRGSVERFQEEELVTPAEARVEILHLQEAQNKLDDEFEAVRDQLRDKLNYAATLVKEAAEIAKTYNREFYDLKQDCKGLYKALDDGGWSHSHMRC